MSRTGLHGFLHDFQEKYFSRYIPSTKHVLLSLLIEIFGNLQIVFIYFPVNDVINFKINLSSLSSRFPP